MRKMSDGKNKDIVEDHRKEPNRRANRNPDYAGQERRNGDRRKSPRI